MGAYSFRGSAFRLHEAPLVTERPSLDIKVLLSVVRCWTAMSE
jgi:hypothetical protein